MNKTMTNTYKSQTSFKGMVDKIGLHNLSLIIALAALLLIFGTIRSDVFFSSRNLLNIGMGVAILGVLAISQTTVIVSGRPRHLCWVNCWPNNRGHGHDDFREPKVLASAWRRASSLARPLV